MMKNRDLLKVLDDPETLDHVVLCDLWDREGFNHAFRPESPMTKEQWEDFLRFHEKYSGDAYADLYQGSLDAWEEKMKWPGMDDDK